MFIYIMEKYMDENNKDHLFAKSYGCVGAEDICDYISCHLVGSRSLIANKARVTLYVDPTCSLYTF